MREQQILSPAHTWSESKHFTGDTSVDIHSPGQRVRRLVSRFHKWCESSDRVHRTFSRGYYRCRECIPNPNGVWEETVLVNVSSSIIMAHAIGCWFLLRLFRDWRSSQGILALPFRPLNSNMSLLPLRLLWRDSRPNCSRILVVFQFQSWSFQSQT